MKPICTPGSATRAAIVSGVSLASLSVAKKDARAPPSRTFASQKRRKVAAT
jgi:hypothetical protein